jgi:branched-chain amino acid transport system substrate-binding protein
VALPACGGKSATVGGAAAQTGSKKDSSAVKDAVNLGAVLPLTGASATIGEDQRRGIELAVEKVNSEGGVLGKKLNVIVEDSTGQASSAIDAARKLTSVDKVPVVIGEYSSGVTIPMGQFLNRQGVVQINPGSSSPDVAKIGNLSFSTIGLDTIAGKFTAQTVYGRGFHKAAFLAPNNAYGQGALKTFKENFAKIGGTVTTEVLYTEGQTDYRAELQRLKQGGPDVYVYTAYGQESAAISNQAFELGMTSIPWFAIYLSMCTADSTPKVAEGQLGMDVNYIGPDGEAYQSAYKKKYNQAFATTFSGYTYDAVILATKAIAKAGSTDGKAIAAAMGEIGKSFRGATGEITFDAQGQRQDQPYAVLRYTGGKLAPLN